MQNAILVFLGGGMGAVARHFMAIIIGRRAMAAGSDFPFHTLCINLLGALLIGIVVETLALRASLPESTRFFLVTGILGGFTTFSAFSLECATMVQRGDYGSAAIYITASVIGTILLVFAGTFAMRTVL